MIEDLSAELATLKIAYASHADRRARAVRWAYTVARRSGHGAAVCRLLSASPPDRRWWVLRQFLPDEAIGYLTKLINGE